MNKRDIIIPFTFIALSLLFAIVCVMVYFSKGQSKKWVARKMWIGGLMLTMSSFSCGNNQYYNDDNSFSGSTCYMIILKELGDGKIDIEIDTNNIIYGRIGIQRGDNYSYSINNNKGFIKQKKDISTITYMSDPYAQEFIIELNENLDTGKYQFKLFNCKLEDQNSDFIIHKYDFKIEK